jgi:hypothetical protein
VRNDFERAPPVVRIVPAVRRNGHFTHLRAFFGRLQFPVAQDHGALHGSVPEAILDSADRTTNRPTCVTLPAAIARIATTASRHAKFPFHESSTK